MFVCDRPHPDGSEEPPPMSILIFDDLLGRMFLLPMDENGERKQATISDYVCTLDQTQASREDQLRFKLKVDGEQLRFKLKVDGEQLRFKLKVDGEQLDDIISYNQLGAFR